jgi:hypothetical protein
MVGEAVGITLLLLPWVARAYVVAKYRIKHMAAGKVRWAWKRGTPDWVTRAMPWLEFLSWAALLGFIAWWLLRPVPVMAGIGAREVFFTRRSSEVSQLSLTVIRRGQAVEATYQSLPC